MECARDHNIIVARVDETGLITVGTDYIRPVITSEGVAKLRLLVPSSWESTEEVTVTKLTVTFTAADSSFSGTYEWDGSSDIVIPAGALVQQGFRFGAMCIKSDGSSIKTKDMGDVIPCTSPGPSYIDDDDLVDLLTKETRLYEEVNEKLADGMFGVIPNEALTKICLTKGTEYVEPGTKAVCQSITTDDTEYVIEDSRYDSLAARMAAVEALPRVFVGTVDPGAYSFPSGYPRENDVYVKVVM